MSLDSCNDVPISPLRALIAVHLTACTVYRKQDKYGILHRAK